VFPVTQWEEEQGTSSVNLRYVAVDEVSSNPRNLTTFKTGQSDSVPCFSEAFPGYIFFMRSAEGQKHVYYMKFDPDAQTHPEPTQLTSLPITVSNLLIKDTKMLVSADVFLDCGNDLQCTANKLEEIKKVAPCGISIQNARNTGLNGVGNELTRDGFHLDLTVGRYIAGLTLAKVFLGVDIEQVTFKPDGVTEEMKENAISCVLQATESLLK
jgi:hypothetical protein